MFLVEIAALSAAAVWAIGGMVSTTPAERLGTIGFNRIRMQLVFVMLAAYVTIFGGWDSIRPDQLAEVLVSGLIGILLGDTALFATLNRLGPRRTAILFSTNAPMSTLLGWIFLDEVLSPSALAGTLLVIAGVVLAIVYGKRRAQLHKWEEIKGPLIIGVAMGLLAALGQSIGSLVAKPVMAAGADPVAVAALRVGITALGLTILASTRIQAFKMKNPLDRETLGLVIISGFLGMCVGMTLILYALAQGDVGVVATLSATTPVLMLPMMWFRTKERPAAGAWIGAVLVVGGTGLIFIG
ncbi:DMT family transporter [Kiloniella laminariae]|uniref:DMT family transporter n=1 Tax=Kiloniella laminariae TaxID=454162 RepID=A0ABT4LGP4_9PROT|nr:DMT family transporter [Kiloniella laminariae]MCZ4279511.1 DMT family transporter [Kiloniella laminariae]